jgi:hypothetical protein
MPLYKPGIHQSSCQNGSPHPESGCDQNQLPCVSTDNLRWSDYTETFLAGDLAGRGVVIPDLYVWGVPRMGPEPVRDEAPVPAETKQDQRLEAGRTGANGRKKRRKSGQNSRLDDKHVSHVKGTAFEEHGVRRAVGHGHIEHPP